MTKLFIVHGWTYSLDKWTKLCEQLKLRDIEPVLLKVPGLTTPSDEVWDIEGYVGWLDEQLKGNDHPIVVGHSNGGRISMAYAQKYPGRLRQLILIDSAGVPHNDPATKSRLKTLRFLSRIAKLVTWVPGVSKLGYKLVGAQDYYNAPANMRLTMQNMLDANNLLRPQELKLPVTIIWGSNDAVTPLSDGSYLHQKIGGSTIKVIDGARHAPYATHPDEVAELLVEAIG